MGSGRMVSMGRASRDRPGLGACVESRAAEQGVEADEAEHNGASQLNSSVRRTCGADERGEADDEPQPSDAAVWVC